MDFKVEQPKVAAGERGTDGIIFEFTLDNYVSRTVTILSYEFQLWLNRHNTGETSFLGVLLPELKSGFHFETKFDPNSKRLLRLAWHYTPNPRPGVPRPA